MLTTPDIGMCILCQPFLWRTIIGRFLADSNDVHSLRNGLKSSDRRGIVKKHGKEEFKKFLGRSNGVLGFLRPNFCFNQGKVDQKPANRHVEPPSGGGYRIIQE